METVSGKGRKWRLLKHPGKWVKGAVWTLDVCRGKFVNGLFIYRGKHSREFGVTPEQLKERPRRTHCDRGARIYRRWLLRHLRRKDAKPKIGFRSL